MDPPRQFLHFLFRGRVCSFRGAAQIGGIWAVPGLARILVRENYVPFVFAKRVVRSKVKLGKPHPSGPAQPEEGATPCVDKVES